MPSGWATVYAGLLEDPRAWLDGGEGVEHPEATVWVTWAQEGSGIKSEDREGWAKVFDGLRADPAWMDGRGSSIQGQELVECACRLRIDVPEGDV